MQPSLHRIGLTRRKLQIVTGWIIATVPAGSTFSWNQDHSSNAIRLLRRCRLQPPRQLRQRIRPPLSPKLGNICLPRLLTCCNTRPKSKLVNRTTRARHSPLQKPGWIERIEPPQQVYLRGCPKRSHPSPNKRRSYPVLFLFTYASATGRQISQ